MSLGNIYNAAVSSAFAYGVNLLPSIRIAIDTAYAIDARHQAKVVSVDMRSAAAFSVSFNRQNNMTAELLASGEYGVTFTGAIEQIVFGGNANVTLTRLEAQWVEANKSVDLCTFTAPANTTLEIRDVNGALLTAVSTNAYELEIGAMYYSVLSGYGYRSVACKFQYAGGNMNALFIPETQWLMFDITPPDATVTVKDANGAVVLPYANPPYNGSYFLPDSRAAGNYTYTVKAPTGYADATGTVTLTQATTKTVALTPLSDACAITEFHLAGDTTGGLTPYSADGVIDENAGTITCAFTTYEQAVKPFPPLCATWTASDGATVTVGGVEQVQGQNGTYNQYGDGSLNFVVTAEDGVTTKTYTVTPVEYTAPETPGE